MLDDAFTELVRDDEGLARVRVRAGEQADQGVEQGVELSWDGACPWVQLYTMDLPEPELDRAGLAVEPMSCPHDAFNSGVDLVVLAPGETHTASWTISAL